MFLKRLEICTWLIRKFKKILAIVKSYKQYVRIYSVLVMRISFSSWHQPTLVINFICQHFLTCSLGLCLSLGFVAFLVLD